MTLAVEDIHAGLTPAEHLVGTGYLTPDVIHDTPTGGASPWSGRCEPIREAAPGSPKKTSTSTGTITRSPARAG
jgi:hypothetical protein